MKGLTTKVATAESLSVEKYLQTAFEHDPEYIDGEIVERPLPQYPHAKLQSYLAAALIRSLEPVVPEATVLTEQRIRTSPRRVRVPDICITTEVPESGVLLHPPMLCVEIDSPDDRMLDRRAKIEEYLEFGVACIWVIDPIRRNGEIHTAGASLRVADKTFRALIKDFPITVDLAKIR